MAPDPTSPCAATPGTLLQLAQNALALDEGELQEKSLDMFLPETSPRVAEARLRHHNETQQRKYRQLKQAVVELQHAFTVPVEAEKSTRAQCAENQVQKIAQKHEKELQRRIGHRNRQLAMKEDQRRWDRTQRRIWMAEEAARWRHHQQCVVDGEYREAQCQQAAQRRRDLLAADQQAREAKHEESLQRNAVIQARQEQFLRDKAAKASEMNHMRSAASHRTRCRLHEEACKRTGTLALQVHHQQELGRMRHRAVNRRRAARAKEVNTRNKLVSALIKTAKEEAEEMRIEEWTPRYPPKPPAEPAPVSPLKEALWIATVSNQKMKEEDRRTETVRRMRVGELRHAVTVARQQEEIQSKKEELILRNAEKKRVAHRARVLQQLHAEQVAVRAAHREAHREATATAVADCQRRIVEDRKYLDSVVHALTSSDVPVSDADIDHLWSSRVKPCPPRTPKGRSPRRPPPQGGIAEESPPHIGEEDVEMVLHLEEE